MGCTLTETGQCWMCWCPATHKAGQGMPGRESAWSCRAPAMQNPVHLRGKRRTITSPRGGIVMTSLVISPGCLSTQSWWGCHVQLGALWLGALRLRELVGLPRSAGCLASCARSGVLCLLWGLVPALGSCARSAGSQPPNLFPALAWLAGRTAGVRSAIGATRKRAFLSTFRTHSPVALCRWSRRCSIF